MVFCLWQKGICQDIGFDLKQSYSSINGNMMTLVVTFLNYSNSTWNVDFPIRVQIDLYPSIDGLLISEVGCPLPFAPGEGCTLTFDFDLSMFSNTQGLPVAVELGVEDADPSNNYWNFTTY